MKKLIVLLGDSSEKLNEIIQEFFEPGTAGYRFPEIQQGLVLSQSQQADWVQRLFLELEENEHFVLCTHSEVIFTAIRLAVAENKIPSEDVEIRWHEKDLPYEILCINKRGGLEHWPTNLFTVMLDLTCQIFTARIKK